LRSIAIGVSDANVVAKRAEPIANAESFSCGTGE
jgi:hypothetical protein